MMPPPPKAYFTELRRVTKRQIIWGANHFIASIPISSPAWIVWDKVNGTTHQSDIELAWTNFRTGARLFRFMWSGMCQGRSISEGHIQQGNKALNEKRIHPTQKPVALYLWLLRNYAKPGQRILDTHLGSGSSAIAADIEGLDFVGMDTDASYLNGALRRLKAHQRQQRLFDAPASTTEQLSLI